MLDLRRLAVEADADDVESRVPIAQAASGQKVPGHAYDAGLFAAIDGLQRRSRLVATPAPDLDEHDRFPVADHKINLPGPAAKVPGQRATPACREEGFRQCLTAPSQLRTPRHGQGR